APSGDEGSVKPRGRLTAPRSADAVMRDLRRVDTDVTDALHAVAEPDLDRVAVVDVDDDAVTDDADGRNRHHRDDERDRERQPPNGTRHMSTMARGHRGINVQ